ncbi:AER006Wp [Eremothecium gossypii ATCC 10895]|uniref:AER006Wp n=1 Tax=Eremothecium gossypii (strain ATCC 10895 / CBS 109.51 / FGSC 9923 / NRRL Y-1056) TaxID=284811 RepID=Q757K6_EREGS|nr:AER006Wp [Eremothecium gossypii ATCC 10895]AAS52690.1 AER006Wp [Eremothecium gossypii ATCC 10895]AEY96995.1 FAER006Wp [Eremothecium gossypii FDAG1]
MSEILTGLAVDSYDSDHLAKKIPWAIFTVWIIALLLCIFLVNLRRRRRGLQPIMGTAWLAPPSYGQSQRQYNMPPVDPAAVPVPEYTTHPNANIDLGYYDNEGKFHPADSSLPKPPPAATANTVPSSYTSAPVREQFDAEYERPAGAPPGAQVRQTSSSRGHAMPGVTDSGAHYYAP